MHGAEADAQYRNVPRPVLLLTNKSLLIKIKEQHFTTEGLDLQ